MLLYPLITAAVIALDQLTKYLVRASMQPGDSIPVIGSWLRILYVRNTGTAFSMFAGNKWITVVFTSVLIIACLIYVIREARSGSRVISFLLTFVIAGGVSNMIDRLTLGYVTDMISCGNFAVFNVADIAVTCGCALTILYLLLEMRKEGKRDSTER
jgi:signal peptidase II